MTPTQYAAATHKQDWLADSLKDAIIASYQVHIEIENRKAQALSGKYTATPHFTGNSNG